MIRIFTVYQACWLVLLAVVASSVSSSATTRKSHHRSSHRSSRSNNTKTNVVILFADNLAYEDVGIFAGRHRNEHDNPATTTQPHHHKSRTPNLDKAAMEGRRLSNWNSPAVLCSASRAALLTGKYPVRTGVYPRVFEQDAAHGLSPEEITLADLLKAHGYATKIVGKWHLGQRPEYLPTERGFDEWFGIPYHMSGGSLDDHICTHKDPNGTLWLPLFAGTSIVEQPVVLETLADRYVEASISFFEEHRSETDDPFFLYLAFSHVHQLCAPRQSECQWAGNHFAKNGGYNATFGDALAEMDWIAGRVLDGLERLGLAENTLVVFTSDNGPWVAEGSCAGSKGPFRGQWLADHGVQDPGCTACPSEYEPSPLPGQPRRCALVDGRRGIVYETEGIFCGEDTGLGSAWEANVRMPAFVKWPAGNIPKGSETMDLVTTLDVLPTVMSLLGLDTRASGSGGSQTNRGSIPTDIDGVDVSDVFLGRTSHHPDNDRPVFFWRDGFASGPLPQPFGRFDVVAMKMGGIKAWFWTKSSHYNADPEVYHDPPLLFDVLKDPAEAHPLDPDAHGAWIARARKLLEEHKESVDWKEPLCLARDSKYAPCVDEATRCRTSSPPPGLEGSSTSGSASGASTMTASPSAKERSESMIE